MHSLIVGLGFGDEGKGSAVDWLCSTQDVRAVIRYNGGPQAAHNVVRPNGWHHTFAQIGSGSFSEVPTHLSEYMLVNPFNLVREAQGLFDVGLRYDVLEHMTISEDALLVTPYHQAANRTRETIRAGGRHGSTGQGIGETRAYYAEHPEDAPVMGDLWKPSVLRRKLELLAQYLSNNLPLPKDLPTVGELVSQYLELVDGEKLNIVSSDYVNTLLDSGDCVFEGAQGVLLDEFFGFFPHCTRTQTTSRNALSLLNGREARTIGITRTYATRHGAGPLPTQNYEVNPALLPEPHNKTGEFQGAWRVGALDLSLLEYAVRANGGVDTIMVSHMDYLSFQPLGIMATFGYDDLSMSNPMILQKIALPVTINDQRLITEYLSRPWVRPSPYDLLRTQEDVSGAIEDTTGVRPTIFSWSPTFDDKRSVGVTPRTLV